MNRVIVVGGGAAGMFAALSAAKCGSQVVLLEKNRMLGKKVLITGKGRCNLTNNCAQSELIKNIPGNGRFLHSAFAVFDNAALMEYFEQLGVKLKVERGGRVFPESDQSLTIVDALKSALRANGVTVELNSTVTGISYNDEDGGYIVATSKRTYSGDAVIIATGGLSYPVTGSTGDGYAFARAFDIPVVEPRGSLVPLCSKDTWIAEAQGLSLRNVRVTLNKNDRAIGQDFGELLFAHFGLTGPTILTLSRLLINEDFETDRFRVDINLKPALTEEILDARLKRDFMKNPKKMFKNGLDELLPLSLIPIFLKLLPIDSNKQIAQLTRLERKALLELLQKLPVNITGLRPIQEAIVTAGGIAIKALDPKTMECKIQPGLYFAGEVIDVDGYTGGYNLQIAFSTGYIAGVATAN